MTFPVMIPIGSWRVHPHLFFEVLAYAVAAGVFLWMRRRRGDALSGADRLSLVTAIFVGALVGSRLLAWFDSPGAQTRRDRRPDGWVQRTAPAPRCQRTGPALRLNTSPVPDTST